MKKIFLTTMLVISFLVPSLVYAQAVDIIPEDACSGVNGSSVCKKSTDDPITGTGGILLNIANILAWFGGAKAVIMIIYAGFVYVTSSGDDGKVKSAKNIILYSVVGLVVIVVARMIVLFVVNRALT